MGRFIRGDVVVLSYPFSDLSNAKRRPAVVIAAAGGADLILCQMTSHSGQDPRAVLIAPNDVKGGVFSRSGYARPTRVHGRPEHYSSEDRHANPRKTDPHHRFAHSRIAR